MHPDVKKTLERSRHMLTDLGHSIHEVSFSTFDHVVSSYYVIATAEASANLARFDGVRYGHRAAQADNPEEMMLRSRTEGFGDEVKLRILLGHLRAQVRLPGRVLPSGPEDPHRHQRWTSTRLLPELTLS